MTGFERPVAQPECYASAHETRRSAGDEAKAPNPVTGAAEPPTRRAGRCLQRVVRGLGAAAKGCAYRAATTVSTTAFLATVPRQAPVQPAR